MKRTERQALYERMYFLEIERREKINARLGLPFGVLLAVGALLSYMLNAPNKPLDPYWLWSFWGLFFASAVALSAGAWFFRLAWFGHTDKLLPTAFAIEQYHKELTELYKKYSEADALVAAGMDAFLFGYYMRFSSENAINNDTRSYNIYRSMVSITIAALVAFVAFVPFYFGKQ